MTVKCQRRWPGWRCTFEPGHTGPCGPIPKWWNLRAHRRYCRSCGWWRWL